MIRIVLIEDQALVRNALRYLLEANPNFIVVGEAATLQDGLNLLQKNKVDLLITDIGLEDSSGIELTRQASVLFPKLKIIILSMYNCYDYIRDAINSGANGYFLKGCTEKELFDGIARVLNNESCFCKGTNQVLKRVTSQNSKSTGVNSDLYAQTEKEKVTLTKREQEILKLINAGYINKEIAARLFLSVRTVDKHRFNILQKFKVNNTAKLLNKVNQLHQEIYLKADYAEESKDLSLSTKV